MANDNITLDDINYLNAVDEPNQSVESSNQLGSVNEDNLTNSGDVYLDNSTYHNVVYHRVDTTLYSDNFNQYAVDFAAGERGGNFSVLLTTQNGNPLSNKVVKIGFNGISRDIITDSFGWARLQINLANANTYTFAVAYLGDNSYNACMNVYTITISKKPTSIVANAKTFKSTAKTKKYTVTLKTSKCSSSNGKIYLKAGKKLTLKLNGKTYTAKTNKNGKATFNLKITKKGKFNAVIKFSGDNIYKPKNKTVKITIK